MPEQKRRGIRTFEELTLFPVEEVETTQEEEAAKAMGRSEELVHTRNQRLCARLYWYRRETKYSYEHVLKELQQEFDITPVTISKIIQEDEWQTELRRLKNKKPDIDYFRRKWPWMKWVVKE